MVEGFNGLKVVYIINYSTIQPNGYTVFFLVIANPFLPRLVLAFVLVL